MQNRQQAKARQTNTAAFERGSLKTLHAIFVAGMAW